eukprot:768109-Hanusia_phi.AAC.11
MSPTSYPSFARVHRFQAETAEVLAHPLSFTTGQGLPGAAAAVLRSPTDCSRHPPSLLGLPAHADFPGVEGIKAQLEISYHQLVQSDCCSQLLVSLLRLHCVKDLPAIKVGLSSSSFHVLPGSQAENSFRWCLASRLS